MGTIIDDDNIYELVELYYENPDGLPDDLLDKSIGTWDVSRVTSMAELFADCAEFNESLNGWDVSNVTEMANMFDDCTDFNNGGEPLNWNTSKLEDASHMFRNCTNFNQPLNLNVERVRDMYNMFENCSSFNQDLSGWNTSNVRDMANMFLNCSSFNQDLSSWNVNRVLMQDNVFLGCPILDANKPAFLNFFDVLFTDEEDEHEDEEIAYEVHVAAGKINYDELTIFLKREVELSAGIVPGAAVAPGHEPTFHEAIPLPGQWKDYIREKITEMIQKFQNGEEDDIADNLNGKLGALMTARLNGVNYQEFGKQLLRCVYYSIEYALRQPDNFQKLYVYAYLKDCTEAYPGGDDPITCVGGAIERLVISLKEGGYAMPGKPEYNRIRDLINANNQELIGAYIVDWFKEGTYTPEHLTQSTDDSSQDSYNLSQNSVSSEDAEGSLRKKSRLEIISEPEKEMEKQRLKKIRLKRAKRLYRFLLKKFPDEKAMIINSMKYGIEGFSDEDIEGYKGGKRKHLKTRKSKKSKKSRKSKNNKKSKKSKKNKKSKKSKKRDQKKE
jgi:surface protein